MIWTDWLLIAILAISLYFCSVSDLGTSTVPNKIVVSVGMVTFSISMIECLFLGNGRFIKYFTNIAAVSLVSVLLYAFHIWGGGDSKLLILVAVSIPVSVYYKYENSAVPLLPLLPIIFSIGFIYLCCDSLNRCIKKQGKISIKSLVRSDYIRFFRDYAMAVAYIMCFDILLLLRYKEFFESNGLVMMILNMFVVLAISDVPFLRKNYAWLTCLTVAISFCIYNKWMMFSTQWLTYAILAVILLLRNFIGQYDYERVAINQLQPGMIISAVSYTECVACGFESDRMLITEDLRSKISGKDIEKIYNLKKKPEYIIIVRKVPFAIFIMLGAIIYVSIGVVSL